MRITVLGLGNMGQAIASRLLDTGHTLRLWNRTPGKATALQARGALELHSIREAVDDAEVVITMVADDAATRAVALGPDGAIAAFAPNTILVDMSTVAPATSRALATAVPGGRCVDAPYLGSPAVAAAGQGNLLLGGPSDLVTQLDQLWSDLSAGHVYCGPSGSGTTLKLVSNLILITGITTLAEALVTAQAQGVADELLERIFSQSPLVAVGLRNRLADLIAGDHEGWFSVTLAHKDLRLALELAAQRDLTLPTTTAALGALERAAATGYAAHDFAAVVEVVRGTASAGSATDGEQQDGRTSRP